MSLREQALKKFKIKTVDIHITFCIMIFKCLISSGYLLKTTFFIRINYSIFTDQQDQTRNIIHLHFRTTRLSY